jgi:hypothetical protein
MKKIIMLVLAAILQALFSTQPTLAAEGDDCRQGTWQEKNGIIFICPAMDKNSSKFEEFKGPTKVIASGESCALSISSVYANNGKTSEQRIFVACGNQAMPYPDGMWYIRFNLGNSEYKFIPEAGMMMLCR